LLKHSIKFFNDFLFVLKEKAQVADISRKNRSKCFINAKEFAPDAARIFFFKDKSRQCRIYGNSMEPFLSFGESVEIVPLAGPLKKGHCYAFINGNNLAVHRFIKMAGNKSALFAGDNCLFFDRVPVSDIIGELFSCQNHCILFIISFTNILSCVFTKIFNEIVILKKLRRRIVRLIIEFEKKGGYCLEKKI
jgi:hypothetical protein